VYRVNNSRKNDISDEQGDCNNLEQIDRVCLDSYDTVFRREGVPESAITLLTIPTEPGKVYYVRTIVSTRFPDDDHADHRALTFSLNDPTRSTCQDAMEVSTGEGLIDIQFNYSLPDLTVAPPSCTAWNDWYQWPGQWFSFVAEQDGQMELYQTEPAWNYHQQQLMVHSACKNLHTEETRIFEVCDIAKDDSPWLEVNAGQRYFVYVAICPNCTSSDSYTFGFQIIDNS